LKSYFIRPPWVYRWLFSDATFRGPEDRQEIYLTFDDGPDPEATDYALRVLATNQVKATFFLLGQNVAKYPEMVNRIKEEGHCVANHGIKHLNGWKTSNNTYIKDVNEGARMMESVYFRPPYGRLGLFQHQQLKKQHRIVFWDVISGDFDQDIDGSQVVDNVVSNIRNGSIIVMHDSQKAFRNLKASLNEIIQRLGEKGYSFKTIDTLLDDKID
jgi:peptidoglycan/xylan/chitin deacetylase (PgdA/CDA1 family)